MKLAVVLFNLGGPDGPDAVAPFLFNLFRDPAIIAAPAVVRYPLAGLIAAGRAKLARANYQRLGGASPLLAETQGQARALAAALAAAAPEIEAKVVIAMRYWAPFAAEAAAEVAAFQPDEIVLLPLYPQYSTTTTASSLKAWAGAYSGPGRSRAVCCYP
ncbi:MAG TPA: ferrochelatase, partial [Phenylobacterium sp.]|nr:ferrochelatase [Phenylobacterium sp.]